MPWEIFFDLQMKVYNGGGLDNFLAANHEMYASRCPKFTTIFAFGNSSGEFHQFFLTNNIEIERGY